MIKYTWVIVLLPFIAAALILFFGKRLPGKGAAFGIAAIAAGWVMSLAVLWHFVTGGGTYLSGVDWFTIGPLHVQAGQFVDGLCATMLVVVTTVSLCVQVYSLGYMKGDARFTWFYFVLSVFTGAMLDVVIAPNLIQLLIGWEVMGVCSYLLIGHWWEVKENSNAAIKAFITTRIGDVPFMFGIFVLIAATGFTTSSIPAISALVASHVLPSAVVAAAALLLFGGTIGKSAQFPLHVWLPDAMAGPTPVSALIHAATMVAAGVYLVARMYSVFINADPWVLQFVGIIGAITMLGAALMALVQDDIKRVLAYSTLSQLAYMVASMSAGPAGRNAAMFHLFTHAFFKALLFLGAGAVIHAVHSNNMSDMGGLRKKMPVTFVTFAIGSYALAGLPLLAGFWSKDGLLVSAYAGHKWLFVVMLITAGLTAFYTARMVWLTFFGEYAGDRVAAHATAGTATGGHGDEAEHHAEPHDPPATMTWPLIGLAFATCVVGFLGSSWFHAVYFKWVVFGEPEAEKFVWWIAILSSVVAIGGAWVGYRMYRASKTPDPLQVRLGGFWTVLQRRFYIDDFYMRDIVFPIRDKASADVYWFNQNVLDRVVNGAAWVTRGFSRMINWFDRTVIDGFVNALGGGAEEAGSLLKYIQNGNVQWYALGLFVGVIALAIIFVKAA